MKIIGITGNSGSGKSFISEVVLNKYKSVAIIDADKIAREMSNINTLYYKEIVKKFGKDILKENLEINRKLLANIIFNNNKKREELNSITFKYVVDEIKNKIKSNNDKAIIIIDVPLLFESGLDKICDITLGVISNEDIKIDRICKRDNLSAREARDRLKVQLNDEVLREKCDYIIENNGNIEELNLQLEEIIDKQGIFKCIENYNKNKK